MVASPTKKLKTSVRSFIGTVAASTASRRGLTAAAAAQAPPFIPSTSTSALHLASSKSKQSARKLLTANYQNFFDADAETHSPSNETIARLGEAVEEQNCWVAELFLQLCPFDPNADPMTFDAFSLADLDREPSNKKPGSSFDPKRNEFSVPSPCTSSSSNRCYYFPPEYKPSGGKEGWPKLYRHIQRCGYMSGSQLVCRKTAGKMGDRYELCCRRSLLHDPTTGLNQLLRPLAEPDFVRQRPHRQGHVVGNVPKSKAKIEQGSATIPSMPYGAARRWPASPM